jgi:ferritin-like metal-binding protein YciE
MGRRMGEKQSNQEDKELVLVAFEGEIASLETLVRLAREYGFRKVLSALVKDLQKAQAETIEIIAMAADDELRERLHVD